MKNIETAFNNLDKFLDREYYILLTPHQRTAERLVKAYNLYQDLADAYIESGAIEEARITMRKSFFLFLDFDWREKPYLKEDVEKIFDRMLIPWMKQNGMEEEIPDLLKALDILN